MTTAHTITPDLIGRTVSIEVKSIAAMGDKAKSYYLDLPGTHVGVVRYYFEDQEGTITLHFDDKSNAARVHPGLQEVKVSYQESHGGFTAPVGYTPVGTVHDGDFHFPKVSVAEMLNAKVGQELTATELDALPLWSIVVDKDGDAMQKRPSPDADGNAWRGAGYTGIAFDSLELAGARLLHVGEEF